MKANINRTRALIVSGGVILILLSVAVLAVSIFEGFADAKGQVHAIQLPGFQEIQLKEEGLYGGIYQHRSTAALPIQTIANLDVRVISNDTYEQVPVFMNNTGQTFDQFGIKVMPVFNFIAKSPGSYSVSGVFANDYNGPPISVMVYSQAAGNIKQTIIVGGIFFALFLVLGILLLTRLNRWAPKEG